jgi:hypothetical protein
MFKRLVVLCGAALLLAGCGTTAFTPQEYPLRPGLIPPFEVAGAAHVVNDQPSTAPTVVYVPTNWTASLNTITEAMTEQANAELQKNGHAKGGTSAKIIKLKVDSLLSEYIAFSWGSEIKFHATLGDGQTIDFDVHHASGILLQDLNGCIAEGVMHLLNDPRVHAYLAG